MSSTASALPTLARAATFAAKLRRYALESASAEWVLNDWARRLPPQNRPLLAADLRKRIGKLVEKYFDPELGSRG